MAWARARTVSYAIRMLLKPPSSGSKVMYISLPQFVVLISSFLRKNGDWYLLSEGIFCQYTISCATVSEGPPYRSQDKCPLLWSDASFSLFLSSLINLRALYKFSRDAEEGLSRNFLSCNKEMVWSAGSLENETITEIKQPIKTIKAILDVEDRTIRLVLLELIAVSSGGLALSMMKIAFVACCGTTQRHGHFAIRTT